MKKTIFILSLSAFTILTANSSVFAQSETPKPTDEAVTQALSQQITDLKEKIASRVAELNLVEKKGVLGTASQVEDTQITLTDIYGKTRVIDVDEITEFSSADDEDSFGISDITPDMKISVLGLYNKETERLLARFVTVVSVPQFLSGKVSEINEDDFSFTLTTDDNTSYTVDVETSTATQQYADEDFEKSGFSDIQAGQEIFVTGFEDTKDPSRISASRILIFSSPKVSADDTSPSASPEEN